MTALVTKYQPKRLKDFAGLTRAKAIMQRVVASPYASSWIFAGDSGTGKTTLALAVAAELNAEVIHVASGACDKASVDDIAQRCHYMPMFGTSPWRIIIVDEADRMTPAAQIAWLSHLDAANPIPYAIVIFTCNSVARLEDRFLSRCKCLEFDGQCDRTEALTYLYKVWYAEAGTDRPVPGFKFGDKVNMRAHLNEIELELLCAGVAA
jgi:putative ATPase